MLGTVGVGATLLLSLLVAPLTYAQPSPPPQVLLINSYHAGLSWTDDIVRGIEETLAENGSPVELYVEYMDTKRLSSTEGYYQALATLYKHKYQNREFDLILVSDNSAFDFITAYHEELFPAVPVVFCGLNFYEPEMLAAEDLITGVVEAVDIRDNLDLMLSLHPRTEEIVVINDTTTTGQIYGDLLREIVPDYTDRVRFTFYDNPDADELPQELPALSKHTLILLILFNRDKQGRFFTYEQGSALIRANAAVPIYGLWDFYLNHGLVGGKLANAYSQGEAVAHFARQILDGTPVSELPVLTESPNRYIFDYQEMQRFNLYPAALPAESEVLNRPVYDFEQYQTIILVSGVVLLVLVAAIVVQVLNSSRQQKIGDELRLANVELGKTQEVLEERVMERTRDLALRSQQLEAVTLVTRAAARQRDLGELLTVTVQRISESFGYYHAGIFLTDQTGKFATLQAASSEGGQRMLARGHRLARGAGIVGSVLETGEPRIALDVGADAVWFDNPDLPATRSEIGLPLLIHNETIGVLDVQSLESNAFGEQDISLLQSMADQVAMAINNASLFADSQRALQEVRRLHGEETLELWRERLADQLLAYRYSGVAVEELNALESPVDLTREDEYHLTLDIPWREQTLAALSLERAPGERPWHPDEVALVEEVAMQAGLALENARLLEETQRRAAYEQQVGEITARIRSRVEIEGILEQAIKELGQALDAEQATARLSLTAMMEEES
ncbi:MAG: GAF domain-containing protein [Chloroflexota bacterium]|nr:GAF domain-containing protein [Chloroflexota bacterium]